jgi:glycosyltransferase involved in cell wall biosynthesis
MSRRNRSSDGHQAKTVVFVVPDYVPYTGGTVSQTRVQAAELVRRGWRVQVLTRRNFPEWPRVERLNGVDVFRIGPPSFTTVKHLLGVTGMWAALALRHRRADVVQVVMDSDSAAAAVLAGLGRRSWLMWGTYGDAQQVLQGPLGRLRRRAMRRYRHIALTEVMREELTDTCGLPEPAVIPVPVDTSHFTPVGPDERRRLRTSLGLPADAVIIVFTGHLEPRKGPERLLRAFETLAASEAAAHLLIVGTGQGRVDGIEDQLRDHTTRHGLSDRVTFAGEVVDVRPYLQSSDIFCLPSWREGMPNSILEAMACGLACVAPATAGSEEPFAGGAGVVPSSNEPVELCEHLRTLVADPTLRRSFAERARQRCEQVYGIGMVIDAYEREWAS